MRKGFKRLLTWLLAASMVFGLSGMTAFAAQEESSADAVETDIAYADASDSEIQPLADAPEQNADGQYMLGSAEDLVWFSDQVNNNGQTSIKAILTEDINVSNASDFAPIGSSSAIYAGEFDGAGHTVTLYFNASSTSNRALFGYTEGAKISNVTIAGTVTGKQHSAGLIGYAKGTNIITNCVNFADVTAPDGYAAGLIGYVFSDTIITDCSNYGNVTASNQYAGGLVGYAGTGEATVDNCFNYGAINGTAYVGGLFGYYKGTSLTNCGNEGNVTGSGQNVGGIAAYAESATTFCNCYNSGDIKGTYWVGGVIGQNKMSSGMADSLYNTGAITGTSTLSNLYYAAGGVIGYANGKVPYTNMFNMGAVSAPHAGALIGGASNSAFTLTNAYYLEGTAEQPYLENSSGKVTPTNVASKTAVEIASTDFLALINENGTFKVGCGHPLLTWEADKEHTWGTVSWDWAEDYSEATASRTCTVCGGIDTATAEITKQTTEPTATKDGETVYTATATFFDGTTVEDTRTVTLPATGEPGQTTNTVNYAVKIWGIGSDTYSTDGGETLQKAGLTFGPALGADYRNGYVSRDTVLAAGGSHDSTYCIHDMTWDEIIAQNALNPSVFEDCKANGCTKAVELTPNDTLFNSTTVNNAAEQKYIGDGVSTLYYLLNGTGKGTNNYTYGAIWNYTYSGYTDADPANIYSKSRIRVTLNGDAADAELKYASSTGASGDGSDLCNETNCLLSCFPENLQAAIVPRTTLNTGNATSGTSAGDKTTYDKLFLFSEKELGITYAYDDGGGSDYGVNASAVAYEYNSTSANTSSTHSWWTRSRYSAGNSRACDVDSDSAANNHDVVRGYGLSPGFSLPSPAEEEHTWGTVTWNWADDYSSATASRTCTVCGVTETVNAEITKQTTEPTATEDGETVYTAAATFSDGTTVEDTRTVTIPATGEPEPEEPLATVNYAVKIWGIQTDAYSEDGGKTTQKAGLTFGPALGDNELGDGTGYIKSYKAHVTEDEYKASDDVYCIHWMTWDEIIAQSKEDPSVFAACKANGCTKAVELTPNTTLFAMNVVNNAAAQGYTGDGVSTLYYLIANNGNRNIYWNLSTDGYSSADPANLYSRSRIRTMLTGDASNIETWLAGDSSRNNYYYDSTYPLISADSCLFSCFPESLREAIVSRETVNGGYGEDNYANYTYDEEVTYDKLWLLSFKELGFSFNDDDTGGTDYGITNLDKERIAYDFSSADATTVTARAWWTRSRLTSVQHYTSAGAVNTSGSNSTYGITSPQGASPCFCLPGPEEDSPVVVSDVSITAEGLDAEGNKIYDGKGVSLTVSADVMPESADLSYQWYKKNSAGGYEPVSNGTEKTLTLDGEVSDSGTYRCVVTGTNGSQTASASAEITITILEAETVTVNYAVKIWGINRDTYSSDGGATTQPVGLTFGAALGDNASGDGTGYVKTYKAHLAEEDCDPDNGAYCIHWMSWNDIIAQSKKDPTVFEDCLKNGCTKTVEIVPNETLFNATTLSNYLEQEYTGDGVSALYYLLNGEGITTYQRGVVWNYTNEGWSESDPADIYSKSRIRVTLNGDSSDAELKYASTGGETGDGSDLCNENNCLFSCFPASLQNGIVSREVPASNSSYDKTTYDRLWLPTISEVGITEASDNGLDYGIASKASDRIAYEFSNQNAEPAATFNWVSRSRYATSNDGHVYGVASSTGGRSGSSVSSANGITPCFCLAGPYVEVPTVDNVKITAEGLDSENTKVFDGKTVTLTAAADVTPETATVTYQWYKNNASISSDSAKNTLTLDGKVSDSATYKCVVTAVNDGEVVSDEAEITVTITMGAQEISYEDTEVEKTVGDEPFTNELTMTLVDPANGSGITYTSSNETVAMVDKNTGEVTILTDGKTTITATAAATENCEGAEAFYTLTVLTNKSALENEIAEVEAAMEGLNPDDYTAESWEALEEALEKAQGVYDNADVSQEDVDAALTALENAWNGLEEKEPTVSVTVTSTPETKAYDGVGISLTAEVTVDPTDAELSYQWYRVAEDGTKTPIEEATFSTYTTGENVADSGTYKCVVTATNGSKTAQADGSVTVEITPAAQDISYEETSMEKTVGDASFINDLTKTVVDPADGSGITYTSSDTDVAKVDERTGEVSIVDVGTTTITATAAATDNYAEATAFYTLTVSADKSGLEDDITKVEEEMKGLDPDAYTADSWKALEEALENAQGVYDNPESSQEEVETALQDLKDAMDGLVNIAELNDMIEEAEALAKDTDAYTADSLQALEEEIASAKAVAENPASTKEQVEAAEEALQNAMDNLKPAATYNGVVKGPDGVWGYYVDNELQTSYTGVAPVKNENGWWYIKEGLVDFSANTVAKNQNGWWYVLDGKVQFDFTGLANYKNENGWWYINSGKVTFDHNGVDKNVNGWWYVVDSKVQFGFTGLGNYGNSNGWWYINAGKVTFDHNGVDKNVNGWWYVVDSKVQFGFTGLGNYGNSNGWWYINSGKVTFDHNGVDKNVNGWWYVVDSKVQFTYTGVADCKNANGWWYIANGKVDFTYTGKGSNKNGIWNVVNGKVQF